MGLGGLLSFPIDELWHTFYGIDSTLWSPHDPNDAAEGARWFEVIAMNGGGLHHARLEPVAPGGT